MTKHQAYRVLRQRHAGEFLFLGEPTIIAAGDQRIDAGAALAVALAEASGWIEDMDAWAPDAEDELIEAARHGEALANAGLADWDAIRREAADLFYVSGIDPWMFVTV